MTGRGTYTTSILHRRSCHKPPHTQSQKEKQDTKINADIQRNMQMKQSSDVPKCMQLQWQLNWHSSPSLSSVVLLTRCHLMCHSTQYTLYYISKQINNTHTYCVCILRYNGYYKYTVHNSSTHIILILQNSSV